MTVRTGSGAALLIIVLIGVGAGLVVMSPDAAEQVLPPQLLPMLPQFEADETTRSCDTIKKGTEYWNSLPLEDVTEAEARRYFCIDRCGGDDPTVGGYCTDGDLTCVCRTDTG